MAAFEEITQQLALLKGVTKDYKRSGDDVKLQIVAMAEGLMDLPIEAIKAARLEWSKSNPYFPDLNSFRIEVIKHMPHRPALANPDKPLLKRNDLPPPQPSVARHLIRLADIMAATDINMTDEKMYEQLYGGSGDNEHRARLLELVSHIRNQDNMS